MHACMHACKCMVCITYKVSIGSDAVYVCMHACKCMVYITYKVSIGSDAVYAAQKFRKDGVKDGTSCIEQVGLVHCVACVW